jgi:thioredoxin reductase
VIDVLVVGSGPAGLTAAAELARMGAGRVVVIERDEEPGGVPRHTDHTGFGIRDLRRVLSGPAYATRLLDRAAAAGADVRCGTTALGWEEARTLSVLEPGSPPSSWAARAVILATGTRERPRSARLVPGDRPAGVLTTGALQQHVRAGIPVGRRAVIAGAEHVSFSAVLTLAHGGCRTVALITELPRHQTSRALWAVTAGRRRVPVLTGAAVAGIEGHGRVEAVVLRDGRRLPCDTAVFTGDWVPEHELARNARLTITPGSMAPVVDAGLRTERAGVFAAGNLLHGAETSDICALDGRHVAGSVATWLERGEWPERAVPLQAEPPLRWIHPTVVRAGERPARGRYLLRVAQFLPGRRLSIMQGDRLLRSTPTTAPLVPNRSIALRSGWEDRVDPSGPAIVVTASDLR